MSLFKITIWSIYYLTSQNIKGMKGIWDNNIATWFEIFPSHDSLPHETAFIFNKSRELLWNRILLGKWSVSPSRTKISARSQAELRECVPNKRVKSVTTLDIRKASGRSEPLENCAPLFRARRPDGYEKYEIWFSRILNGVQAVFLAHRTLAVPLALAIHRSTCVSWEDLETRGIALCQPASRTLSIEKRGKQVLERELTCPSRPFHSRSFHEKNPFPRIFDQNKSYRRTVMRPRAYSCVHASWCGSLDIADSVFASDASSPPPPSPPLCPRRAFENISQACMAMRGL